jgi:hypothetical protein
LDEKMSYRVFISLRFAEAETEARALKAALEARGITAFLCAVAPGSDIAAQISNALDGCQLAIIMGTRTYGKNTGVAFSTLKELRFIQDEPKPFFLVKMCERFEEAETRMRLDSAVSYFRWISERPISENIENMIARVLEKLASVSAGISSSIPPAPHVRRPVRLHFKSR